jgi:hypothetical protein
VHTVCASSITDVLHATLCAIQAQERCGDGSLPQDDFRNERFKLIPNICEGPFIIRRAVGNKVRAGVAWLLSA